MAVNPYSKAYLTDEERAEPFWFRGEHFEIYTSYDPNKLGMHIVPLSRVGLHIEEYGKIELLNLIAHDMVSFGMHWWPQVKDRLNGFMFSPKRTIHEYGWEPKDGYDKKILLTKKLQ